VPQSARHADVFVLHAALEEVLPPVWRRFAVRADVTFQSLHEVLQVAFSWRNYHLFEFEIAGETIGLPGPEDPAPVARDPRFTRLRDVLAVGEQFLYRYDFGDDWLHLIKVERKQPADPSAVYPCCMAGERSAPPEDSGGPDGYSEIVEILSDPTHPERESTQRWAGDDFDPEGFDLASVNSSCRVSLRPDAESGAGRPAFRSPGIGASRSG
jgi:hypothetical protein